MPIFVVSFIVGATYCANDVAHTKTPKRVDCIRFIVIDGLCEAII